MVICTRRTATLPKVRQRGKLPFRQYRRLRRKSGPDGSIGLGYGWFMARTGFIASIYEREGRRFCSNNQARFLGEQMFNSQLLAAMTRYARKHGL